MSDSDKRPLDVPALKRALAHRYRQVRDNPDVVFSGEHGSVKEQRHERALLAIYELGHEDARWVAESDGEIGLPGDYRFEGRVLTQAQLGDVLVTRYAEVLAGTLDHQPLPSALGLVRVFELGRQEGARRKPLEVEWKPFTAGVPGCPHDQQTVVGEGQHWCVKCGALDLGKGWLRPSDTLVVARRTDEDAPQLRAVPDVEYAPYEIYDEAFANAGRDDYQASRDKKHHIACRAVFEAGTYARRGAASTWPPAPGGSGCDPAAMTYNATWERLIDAPERYSEAEIHLACCAEVQRKVAESRELERQAAERRGAQLRQLVERLVDGTLSLGAEAAVKMADVQPTDLLVTERGLFYVEASAPSFRASPDDDQPQAWTLHTIRVDNRPGHQSDGGMQGGAGDQWFKVHRLLYAPAGWTCPTCLCTNQGDECMGCGTTKTERAFYAKRADEED